MKSPQKKRAVKYATVAVGILFSFFLTRLLFAQATRERLVAGYAAVDPSTLPLWIAVEKGFFNMEGLDARFIFIRGSPTLLSAMVSGDIQAIYTGGTAVLNGAARGLDLQIVANIRSKLTVDIVARPEIKKPADLRSKILGVYTLGGTNWMGGMLGLEYLGLDPIRDNVKVITVGDQTVLAQALEARKIDAAVIAKPLSNELRLKGFVFLAELSKVDIPIAGVGLTFRRSFIQKRPETVRRSLRALIRANGYLFSSANKAGVIETLVKRLGIQSPTAAASAYEAALESIDQKPYPSSRGLENIQRLLGRLNPDVARVSLAGVVDASFMEELEKSGFIDEAFRTGGKAQ